jgi:protein TonB
VKFRTAPEYPAALRQANIEGEVLVDFVVTSEGKVVSAFAARSTRREFEGAAISAVKKWKFQAGVKAGRVVNTHMQVPIAFALRED